MACPVLPRVPDDMRRASRSWRTFDTLLHKYSQDVCLEIAANVTDTTSIEARLDALEALVANHTIRLDAIDVILSTLTGGSGSTGDLTWIVPPAYPYTIGAGDVGVLVNTAAARVINLPFAAANAGKRIHIKDITGSAGTNNITVTPQAGETVDGDATFVVDVDLGGAHLESDGTNWQIT